MFAARAATGASNLAAVAVGHPAVVFAGEDLTQVLSLMQSPALLQNT